ncbi:hypothetical protein FJZ18_00565 [Candidatus Pacearchaeota archaeon]|nr:hypothetical protein [Candidatus Pacearchaeota archaeon]
MAKSKSKKPKSPPKPGQEEFDSWKNASNNYYSLENAGKNLKSENPDERGAARGNLERVLKAYTGITFGRHDDENHMLKHYPGALNDFSRNSLEEFKKNPSEIIDYAYSDQKNQKKFANNYLNIDPHFLEGKDGKYERKKIELGKSEDDKIIAETHSLYFLLNEETEKVKSAKELGATAEFISKTSQLLEGSLFHHFILSGSSEVEAGSRARLIRETYDSSNPNEAYQILNITKNHMKNHMNSLVNESNRAEYAMKLIKAKANKNDLINIGQASQDLYKALK